jgi:hypothetical protein
MLQLSASSAVHHRHDAHLLRGQHRSNAFERRYLLREHHAASARAHLLST